MAVVSVPERGLRASVGGALLKQLANDTRTHGLRALGGFLSHAELASADLVRQAGFAVGAYPREVGRTSSWTCSALPEVARRRTRNRPQ